MSGVIVEALKQRILVFVVMLAVFAGGVVAFMKLNIEAYPDPVPPLVDIIVQSPGSSAEEVERYMTIPVEIQMAGIPNVSAIRTISKSVSPEKRIIFPPKASRRAFCCKRISCPTPLICR